MAKSKPKIQKRLAKLVLAALLCTGGVQTFISPSVAHAEVAPPVKYGTVTKDGVSVPFTSESQDGGDYSYVGNIVFTGDRYDTWKQSVEDYIVSVDNMRYPILVGGGGTDKAIGNSVTVGGANSAFSEVIGGQNCYGYLYSTDVLVSNNTVTINEGDVSQVIGGNGREGAYWAPPDYSEAISVASTVSGNKVFIKGGTVGQAIGGQGYGSYYDYNTWTETDTLVAPTTVSGNEVNIEGGTIVGRSGLIRRSSIDDVSVSVAGGVAIGGAAIGNKVNISDGKFGTGDDSGAGAGSSPAPVGGSALVRGSGIIEIAGGYSTEGNATDNIVTITNGTFGSSNTNEDSPAILFGGGAAVYGGETKSGDANHNTVTISGGTFDASGFMPTRIYGGQSNEGSANHNTVTVSGGAFSFTPSSMYLETMGNYPDQTVTIVGGQGTKEASNNTVTVSTSIDGAVIVGGEAYSFDYDVETGEQVETAGIASNNTVNILAPVNAAYIIGGYGDESKSVGNTLNVAAKNVTTYQLIGFQNMNFYLPADIAKGDTMLTVKKFESTGEDTENTFKQTETDLTGVTFGVAALSGVNLEVGNTVNLIVDENGLKTDDALKTADSKELGKAEFLSANNMSTDDSYGMSISKQGANAIIATVESKTSLNNEDRYKSAAETRESVVTLVNTAADLLAGQGLSNASDAAGAAGGRMEPFAAIGGSNLRAESGSHVTTKGFGLNLGFAKEIKNKSGKLLIGPMVEYGHGRYDSYQDDGTKADGKSHYWGIGVLAKQTNNNGLYYEGSLRVGRTGSDYTRNVDANLPNYHADYDSKSTYWGAHLGIGKVMDIGHKNTLDYYGKYFYSHTGGDTTTMHTNVFGDVETRFDSVNSHRLRLGARVTHALNEKNKFYGGLAWQYEFNGDAKVSYSTGGAAPSPSVKGSSGMIELGWQVKPGKSPMVIDLGVTGWVGKQRGVTANLQANWTF